MIVKMKKLTLLVSANERRQALTTLRRLGVLHVQHIKTPSSEEIYALQNQLADVDKAVLALEGLTTAANTGMEAPNLVRQTIDWVQQKERLTAELHEKREARAWFDNWGQVSLESLVSLREAGVVVRFYKTDKDGLNKVPADKQIAIVRESKDGILLACFGAPEEDGLDLPEQRMPQVEVAELQARTLKVEQELEGVNSRLTELAAYRAVLAPYKTTLIKQLELNNVLYGMGDEAQFAYLAGFCPFDQVDEIKTLAEKNGWGFIAADPDDPSEVPTLLRNKKPIRIIQPLFDFMGTFPGYQEMDVSLVFLLAFTLFYAMIVGDAGYGLIFLAITTWVALKFKKAPKEPIILFFVLSIATIIWGTITGTWFGSEAISKWPVLNKLIIPQLYSFAGTDEASIFMMKLTFLIGILHLTLARLLSAGKKLPSPTALAEIGWILILWCVYFVAKQLVLSVPMPGFALYLLLAGVLLAGLFANFQKNILKGFLISIGNLPLSILSSFGDIVSYIRLFAVGIATVTVAASFNNMAHGLAAPIILLLGHGLNIVLSMMSVLVHGVRLNMLEFSGHLGQEWSGKEYKPFKE